MFQQESVALTFHILLVEGDSIQILTNIHDQPFGEAKPIHKKLIWVHRESNILISRTNQQLRLGQE
jgi:hypothetical protein